MGAASAVRPVISGSNFCWSSPPGRLLSQAPPAAPAPMHWTQGVTSPATVCCHWRAAIAARRATPCRSFARRGRPPQPRPAEGAGRHMCVPPPARRDRSGTSTHRTACATPPPFPAATGVPAGLGDLAYAEDIIPACGFDPPVPSTASPSVAPAPASTADVGGAGPATDATAANRTRGTSWAASRRPSRGFVLHRRPLPPPVLPVAPSGRPRGAGWPAGFPAHAVRPAPLAGRDPGPRARHGGRLPHDTRLVRSCVPEAACFPLCPQGNCPHCCPFGPALERTLRVAACQID